MILESITGYVTAPSGTETALTMYAGDSTQVRNFDAGSKASIIAVSVKSQGAGIFRVLSPHMHDAIAGLNYNCRIGNNFPSPLKFPQPLYANDVLNPYLSGSATGGDVELATLTFYYQSIQGLNGNYVNSNVVANRAVNQFQVQTTHVANSTGTGYTASVAINTTNKQMRAGHKYACIGATFSLPANVAGVRLKCADIGNVGVVIPCIPNDVSFTANYFDIMSGQTGLDCIPVVDMTTPGQIYLDLITDENNPTCIVTTNWVELA
jgi:hypothetical protein